MKLSVILLTIVICALSCKRDVETANVAAPKKLEPMEEERAAFGIAIHGGAGTILKKNMTDSMRTQYSNKLEEAIRRGHSILKEGGSSLDAIEATIRILEDSPLFNAGKGSVFAHNETNQMDSSIMNGKTLEAGAVAGVTTVKNPISLAKKVMNNSPHVLLSGRGAEEFGQEQGIEIVDPEYFYTEGRMNTLKKVKEKEKQKAANTSVSGLRFDHDSAELIDSKFGTVGCVALDQQGNLAAGTSTGGMTNKRWNRIGDTPIIGAGTYANNKTCAVSSTGWGEFFIRAMVAHDISALMEYKELSLSEAAHEVIHNKVAKLGGDGGVVAMDYKGNAVFEFNTPGMYRAAMSADGTLTIGMYEKESVE